MGMWWALDLVVTCSQLICLLSLLITVEANRYDLHLQMRTWLPCGQQQYSSMSLPFDWLPVCPSLVANTCGFSKVRQGGQSPQHIHQCATRTIPSSDKSLKMQINWSAYKVMCFDHKGLVSYETPAAAWQLNINQVHMYVCVVWLSAKMTD